MLDSLLQFLEFLPAGLLFAAVCLEGFVLSRRDRDSEPAVLWLLYCAAVAAALVSVLGFTLYFTRIDPEGLKSGLWSGLLAAAASVAWSAFPNLSGGLTATILFTPATLAGTAAIIIIEGKDPLPRGM
jgi:FtsH-binding integral membrane protein